MKRMNTIVIAAAGQGTRLQVAYPNTPKHLIEVSGKPFLSYVLAMVRQAGFTRIIVTIAHQADQMRKFFSEQPGEYILVDQTEQMQKKYGTAAVIEAVQETVGDQSFVYINGDALKTPDALESVRVDDGFVHMVGAVDDQPQRYGVLMVDADGWLQGVVEKPERPASNLINIGVYAFPPEIFSLVRTLKPSVRGEYELTDALNVLAAQRRVKVHQLAGEWVDLGRPEDVPRVEAFLQRHHMV